MKRILIFISFSLFIFFSKSYAQEIPHIISFQGKLVENGVPVTGTKTIKFSIDSWSETKSVQIENGLYSVKLGENNPLPASLFNNNTNLKLNIEIDGTSMGTIDILSSPYAFKSEYSESSNNSEKLNEKDPEFYNNWDNLTNIPADIADGDDVDDADNNPSNECQSLSIDGKTLTISPCGNSVTLPGQENLSQTLSFGNSAGNQNITDVGDLYSKKVIADELNANTGINTVNIKGKNLDLGNSGTIKAKEILSSGSYLGLFANKNIWMDIDHDDNNDASFAITANNDNKTLLSIWENRISLLSASYSTNYPIYLSKSTKIAGDLNVSGNISKGGGSFKIDHPLDPENKYLCHSFVESPDMMNIYNGNVILDEKGEAVVELPEWFETLNMDFRYQLTCIGGYAPIYIAEKIKNNKFKIAGGKNGLEVSWQVTGIRHDPYANKHRIKVEVEKTGKEKGHYLYYKEYNQPFENSIEAIEENK